MLVLGAVFVLNNSIILLSGQRGPLGRPGCLNLRAGEPVLALQGPWHRDSTMLPSGATGILTLRLGSKGGSPGQS